MEEELTLRDIADILARYRAWLVALPLASAAALFTVGSMLPPTYASEAAASITTAPRSTDDSQAQYSTLVDPSLLPNGRALAEAYGLAATSRLPDEWSTTPQQVANTLSVSFDDKTSAVTVTAQADTPQEARRRAELALNDLGAYVDNAMTDVLRSSLASQLEQVQFNIEGDQTVIERLQSTLADTPTILPGTGQASVRDQLADAGVDRRFAGDTDAPANPAYSLLATRVAETQARLATNEALRDRLVAAIENPAQLLAISRQASQMQRLANATLPLSSEGIGREVLAVLGFLLGGLMAVLGAFVHHALRPAGSGRNAAASTAGHEPAPLIAQQGD